MLVGMISLFLLMGGMLVYAWWKHTHQPKMTEAEYDLIRAENLRKADATYFAPER